MKWLIEIPGRFIKKEIEQLQKHVISAQIKLAIAQKDLDHRQIQIDNNKEAEDFMRNKFINQQLYDSMMVIPAFKPGHLFRN